MWSLPPGFTETQIQYYITQLYTELYVKENLSGNRTVLSAGHEWGHVLWWHLPGLCPEWAAVCPAPPGHGERGKGERGR